MPAETECPVCSAPLPAGAKSEAENEAHIAACISSRLSGSLNIEHQRAGSEGDDKCPICHLSFLSRGFHDSPSKREEHVAACLDKPTSFESPPGYNEKSLKSKLSPPSNMYSEKGWSSEGASFAPPPGPPPGRESVSNAESSKARNAGLANEGRHHPGLLHRLGSKLTGDIRTTEEKMEAAMPHKDERMIERWGYPNSPTYQLVMRYWVATRMKEHWLYLRDQHPKRFKKYLDEGYMEPIPTRWVQDRRLAQLNSELSTFETPAEERLYYLLNNGVMPDGSHPETLRPLNFKRDMHRIIKRGNARNARQVMIDPSLIAQYRSVGDVFQRDNQIKSHEYSAQVPNIVYATRQAALHELADGIIHGTDHLETMLLIDVSGSMTWDPHEGVMGPDGIVRYHDQPANIQLTEHLVHRVLNHMVPRARKEHPNQTGIDTVTFSTYGNYVGQLRSRNFRKDWISKVNLGGGTQVMQGWQVVKNTYFQHQHETYGHGRFDDVFGWQPTPGMPKLSLLVFLDGEAQDMDEFELELLGETWAYVTIALVGMENCPHHHSHAIELERVARFNPHVGFFDVHGRVCERLVVQDLLKSVYPVDPPTYDEILRPEYDITHEERLPIYS